MWFQYSDRHWVIHTSYKYECGYSYKHYKWYSYYRNEFYFCGFHCLWVIHRSLHIEKIHKNNNSFLIIPAFSSKWYFVHIIGHFRNWRKENSSGIPVYGIYWSVKLFLQPIKWLEISITLRSWNYMYILQMSRLMRLWYLSLRRRAKAQVRLRICAISPEPSLLVHIKYGSRRRVWPKIRRVAPVDFCTCLKIE